MNSALAWPALSYSDRMTAENEFFSLHREYLDRSDCVKTLLDEDGGWGVYIQIGGPYQTADRAREVAELIAADLTDVYRASK